MIDLETPTGLETRAAPVDERGAYGSLTVWAALSLGVLLGLSRLSYGLLLPALRADLTGSYRAFGLVGSANLAGYLVGTLCSPAVVSRSRDRIRLNTMSLLATGATMIGSALSANLLQLGLWRFAVGVSAAVATVLTISLTLERIVPREQGRASGVIWTGGAVGVALSGAVAPLVVSAAASPAWRVVWATMGLIGFGVAWGLHRALRASAVPRRPGTVAAPLAKSPGTLAVLAGVLHPARLLSFTLAYFLFGGGYIIYFTFFIALVVQTGFPAAQTGLIWVLMGLMGAVGGVGWGRVVDRWPSGFVFAGALALGAIGALTVLVPARWVEVLGALLMGTAFIGAPALMTALLRRAVPGSLYAANFSLVTAIFATAQMLGPLLGGIVADAHGLTLATALSGVILAGGALFAALYGLLQSRRITQTK